METTSKQSWETHAVLYQAAHRIARGRYFWSRAQWIHGRSWLHSPLFMLSELSRRETPRRRSPSASTPGPWPLVMRRIHYRRNAVTQRSANGPAWGRMATTITAYKHTCSELDQCHALHDLQCAVLWLERALAPFMLSLIGRPCC